MSVHEMTSKCINIDFRFNVPCTLFRQKGAQILCFRGNFYCSVNPNYLKKMEAKQERMVQAFEQTYEKIADVSQTQIDTLDQFTDAVTELKAFTSSLLEQQASLNDAFTRIHDKSDELVKNME